MRVVQLSLRVVESALRVFLGLSDTTLMGRNTFLFRLRSLVIVAFFLFMQPVVSISQMAKLTVTTVATLNVV